MGLLLERYRASLHGKALGILGYGPQAEDAVHDTFVVAMRKIDGVREPAAVGGWLHAVLRNICLMRLRAGQGEVLSNELYGGADSDPSAPTGEAAIEQLAMREWVWTALSELPEVLRVTAMLRYFGSYTSYAEISAILGVPVGTVRSRLAQVKTKLADALLETVGLAHEEAGRITASSNRFFSELFAENNRSEVTAASMDFYSEDAEIIWTDGTSLRGRENLAAGFREDQEAGVKLHLTNVLASRDIVVVEADFENPPEDPFHCPPVTTQVYFYRSGRIQQIRFYYATRPNRED
ncbi:MAG: sigma-70 family RNA polymerase sigma factor [Rubrobacter sp.]|nr:sigma-70 family RNA polymerase sigma factor [Rubrobacter sp.]